MDYKMDEIEKRIKRLFDGVKADLGIDLVKDQEEFERKGRHTINISLYNAQKASLEIDNLINTGKFDKALIAVNDNISTFLDFRSPRKEDLLSDGHIWFYNYHRKLRELLDIYNEYKEKGYQSTFERYTKLPFFKEDDFKNKELPPKQTGDGKVIHVKDKTEEMLEQVPLFVERTMDKKLFNTYIFEGGDDVPMVDDEILFYPQIGISRDIKSWFSFLKKQEDFMVNNPDKIVATLYLRIDDIEPMYSNFYITLHKCGTIWVSTDEHPFSNPGNKVAQASRGRSSGKLGRIKEDHFDNIGLPYELIWEYAKLQEEGIVSNKFYERVDLSSKISEHSPFEKDKEFNKRYDEYVEIAKEELIKHGVEINSTFMSHFDRFSLKIQGIELKFNGELRAFFEPNVNGMLTIYKAPEIKLHDLNKLDVIERYYFVNLVEKLLENIVQFRPNNQLILSADYLQQKMLGTGKIDPMDEGFEAFTDSVKEEIKDLLDGAEVRETGLALTTYQAVLPTKYYNANALMTPQLHENHIRWSIINERRADLQKGLDKLGENAKQDVHKLYLLLKKRSDDVLMMAYSGKEIHVLMDSPVSGFNSSKREQSKDLFASDFKHTNSIYDFRTHWDYITYLGIEEGYNSYFKEDCPFCGNYKTRKQREVKIRHYKQLMFLLRLEDRNELPAYFRNYRAHEKKQYRGNSALRHIHPYASLRDPASERYPNGLRIGIYCCNKCHKKFHSEYNIEDNVEFEIL